MNGKLITIFCFFSSLLALESVETFPTSRVVLVTGGAGYIGSHTCKTLREAGFLPVTYDSLAFGEKEAVQWGPLFQGDLLDAEALERAFKEYKPEAVIHFASLRNVGESVENPESYYTNNIMGSINLLNLMIKYRVKYIIFSSSCTVYGNCPLEKISEESPQAPINPYGSTKQFVERMIRDYAHVHPLKYVIMRYFNAAGLGDGLKRSVHSSNFLIPRAIRAVFDPDHPLEVFGFDYSSQDGTAIRDYIHVNDLARAHVMALNHLLKGEVSDDFNIGTGQGYSVLEIIQSIEEVTGAKVPYELKPQREGDAPRSVAENEKVKEILGFELCNSNLNEIIKSEWEHYLEYNK